MAGLPVCITEPGIRKLAAGIEGQVVVIISVHKRCDRMIQEVIRREAELQLLLFAEVKVLEHRQIAVQVGRTLYIGEDVRSVVARCGRTEAVPVDELVRSEVLAWIAQDYRLDGDVR